MQHRNFNVLKSVEFKIILIAVFLRLLGITSPYISDESMWSETAKYMHQGNFDPMILDMATNTVVPPNIGIPHPPLGITLYFINTALFGVTPMGMRLVPLIFGIGVLCVTYLLSKRMYDRRTAILTLVLLAFSFYPVWSSLYIDIDGSILLFFITSSIYCYFRFHESKSDRVLWLRLSAISFGLGLLVKYTAMLILPVMLLAEFFHTYKGRITNLRKIAEIARPLTGIFLIGMIIWSVFPIGSYLTGRWGAFIDTLSYGADTLLSDKISTQTHTLSGISISLAKNIFFILQYATPLIPILAFLSLKNRTGKEKILFSWIAIFLIFYTFLVPGGGKVRYLMVIIPPLYIMAARGFLNIADMKKRETISVVLMSVAFLGIIAALNMYGTMKTFNTHNLSIQTVIDNGFLWYSALGSSVFAIHIHSFIFVVTLSGLLFALSFRQSYFRNAILAILALSMAFNGFILSESFNQTVGPNYKETLPIIATDYNTTKGPIYGINQFKNTLNLYFDGERIEYSEPILERDAAGNLSWSKPKMKGKIIVVDVEQIDNPLYIASTGKYLSENCRLEKTYYSNNYPFGYIYDC